MVRGGEETALKFWVVTDQDAGVERAIEEISARVFKQCL